MGQPQYPVACDQCCTSAAACQPPKEARNLRVHENPHPGLPGPTPRRRQRHPPHRRHYRVRHDKIDHDGKLTLRHGSRLHHIGIGARHRGSTVLILVHDLHVRVLATSGQPLRDLQLDPTRDYQPQPKNTPSQQLKVFTMTRDIRARCPETSHWVELRV